MKTPQIAFLTGISQFQRWYSLKSRRSPAADAHFKPLLGPVHSLLRLNVRHCTKSASHQYVQANGTPVWHLCQTQSSGHGSFLPKSCQLRICFRCAIFSQAKEFSVRLDQYVFDLLFIPMQMVSHPLHTHHNVVYPESTSWRLPLPITRCHQQTNSSVPFPEAQLTTLATSLHCHFQLHVINASKLSWTKRILTTPL